MSEWLGPLQRPMRAHAYYTGAAQRGTAHVRQRPWRDDPRARRVMQKSPQLPIKWNRSPFHYSPLSQTLALNPPVHFEFALQSPCQNSTEAAASLANRRRAQASSASTNTSLALYERSATDRGITCHKWRNTKAWPCAAVGSGHGNTGAGEFT